MLTTGILSAEHDEDAVFAGLQKASGTAEVRGGVMMTATGTVVNQVKFALATTAGGEPVPVNPAETTSRTVLTDRHDDTVDNDVALAVTNVVGDGDTLLEPGELMLITINVSGGGISPQPTLVANERFTFQLQTPVGAVLDITRRVPPELAAVM